MRVRPAQQERHLDPERGTAVMTAASTYRPAPRETCAAAVIFAPGDAELKSRKKLRGYNPAAQASAATTV